MKYFILILLCYLSVGSAFAQKDPTLNLKDSLYYKNGKIYSGLDTIIITPEFPNILIISKYNNGYKEFEQDFDFNSKIKISSKYLYQRNRIADGLYFRYSLNGNIISQENYLNGKADGIFKSFHDYATNNISKIGYYIAGKREGVFILRSDSGLVERIEIFRHDTIIYSLDYFPNGKRYIEQDLYGFDKKSRQNLVNGQFKEYNEHGSLIFVGTFKMGKPINAHRYFETNHLIKEVVYDDKGNLIETREFLYDKNGNRIKENITKPK